MSASTMNIAADTFSSTLLEPRYERLTERYSNGAFRAAHARGNLIGTEITCAIVVKSDKESVLVEFSFPENDHSGFANILPLDYTDAELSDAVQNAMDRVQERYGVDVAVKHKVMKLMVAELSQAIFDISEENPARVVTEDALVFANGKFKNSTGSYGTVQVSQPSDHSYYIDVISYGDGKKKLHTIFPAQLLTLKTLPVLVETLVAELNR